MEQRIGRSKHQSEVDPITQMRNSFARIGRQLRTMERLGVNPPTDLLERQRKIDYFLTQQNPLWFSHFGYKRGEPMENSTSAHPEAG